MPLKKLKKILTGVRRKKQQKFAMIVKAGSSYKTLFFFLESDQEHLLKEVTPNEEHLEIVEVRKIPQHFTENQLKRRAEMLTRRERKNRRS